MPDERIKAIEQRLAEIEADVARLKAAEQVNLLKLAYQVSDSFGQARQRGQASPHIEPGDLAQTR